VIAIRELHDVEAEEEEEQPDQRAVQDETACQTTLEGELSLLPRLEGGELRLDLLQLAAVLGRQVDDLEEREKSNGDA
jgi:hypothetical protein